MRRILFLSFGMSIIVLSCAAYLPSPSDPIDKMCSQCGDIAIFRRSELDNTPLICYNCERRNTYISAHPNLGQATTDAILTGTVLIGMTKEEVIASYGEPSDINRSVYEWGIQEQWIHEFIIKTNLENKYPVYLEEVKYLYFENGILKSWQD